MKKVRFFSLLIIVLSVLLLLVPWQLFPVCGVGRYAIPGGMMQMHGCSATLKAVVFCSVIGILIGLIIQLQPKPVTAVAAAIAFAVLGVLVILFPTTITGVCLVATMPCVWGTKPALIVTGFLMALSGIAGFYIFRRAL
jgi:hypothetical protein